MLLSCISFRPNLPQVFLVATQEVTFRRFISQFAQSASIVSCCHIYHLFITVVASGAKFSPDLSHFSCSWSTSHLLASEGCQQLPCSSCSPLWGRCHKYRGGLWSRSHNISTLDANKGSSFALSRWFVWKKSLNQRLPIINTTVFEKLFGRFCKFPNNQLIRNIQRSPC